VRCREGTTELGRITRQGLHGTYNAVNGYEGSVIVDGPTAASHTYKATINRVSGSADYSHDAAANVPAWIMVTDIGPAS